MDLIFKDFENYGKLDYVTAWFKKSLDYMKFSPNTRTAFVATNSICQGEQVALLWKPLFESGVSIDFAYTSFKWDNSVDFGTGKKEKADKIIRDRVNLSAIFMCLIFLFLLSYAKTALSLRIGFEILNYTDS